MSTVNLRSNIETISSKIKNKWIILHFRCSINIILILSKGTKDHIPSCFPVAITFSKKITDHISTNKPVFINFLCSVVPILSKIKKFIIHHISTDVPVIFEFTVSIINHRLTDKPVVTVFHNCINYMLATAIIPIGPELDSSSLHPTINCFFSYLVTIFEFVYNSRSSIFDRVIFSVSIFDLLTR